MEKPLVILSIIFLCILISGGAAAKKNFGQCCIEYCYSEDALRPQDMRMNTKTAYQLVKENGDIEIPKQCSPFKFWLLSRHGTRLPTPSHIPKLQKLLQYQSEIIANYANGKGPVVGGLCDADLKLLKEWHWNDNITEDVGDFLTVQGWNDLKGLGEFYKEQFPNLFQEYSSKYVFKHTDTQRTEASYKAFVDGLFGDGAHERIPAPLVPATDTLLRPYDYCGAWTKQKEEIDAMGSEVSKWKNSDLFLQMVEDVSTKAGYSDPLKAKTIDSMFEMCAFDVAWSIGTDSAWCSLFTMDQIKILEYAKDMSEWYESGPATELNSKLSCELVQDMIARLESTDGPTTFAYFGHATTFQLFLTSLGIPLHSDTPLRADNYPEMANRSWMTSKISPFATNLAVLRFDCADGAKVQFVLNQKPLQLDWCSSSEGLCTLQELRSRAAKFTTEDCATYFCPKETEKDIKVTLYVNN